MCRKGKRERKPPQWGNLGTVSVGGVGSGGRWAPHSPDLPHRQDKAPLWKPLRSLEKTARYCCCFAAVSGEGKTAVASAAGSAVAAAGDAAAVAAAAVGVTDAAAAAARALGNSAKTDNES